LLSYLPVSTTRHNCCLPFSTTVCLSQLLFACLNYCSFVFSTAACVSQLPSDPFWFDRNVMHDDPSLVSLNNIRLQNDGNMRNVPNGQALSAGNRKLSTSGMSILHCLDFSVASFSHKCYYLTNVYLTYQISEEPRCLQESSRGQVRAQSLT